MLDPNGRQQLDVALAGFSAIYAQKARSLIASATSAKPELKSTFQDIFAGLETSTTEIEVVANRLASAVAGVTNLQAQEELARSCAGYFKTLTSFFDRAVTGDAKTWNKRRDWVRKVRLTFAKSSQGNELHGRLVDAYLAGIQDFLQLEEAVASMTLESRVTPSHADESAFPLCWEILAYLLPRDARRRIYEPARAELLEDYLQSRPFGCTWWSRLLVNGVFLVRTLLLACECGRVIFNSNAVKYWLWLMGPVVAAIIRLTHRPSE